MSNTYHDRTSSRGTTSSDKKYKSHKSSSSKSSRGRPGESSGGSSRPANPGMSFLFVVNKLDIYFPDAQPGFSSPIPYDQWENALPPTNPAYYTTEYCSKVMRFSNGSITDVSRSYRWTRDQQYAEGYIQHVSSGRATHKYKSASVFSCNPLLPIVTINGDARIQTNPLLHALKFFHPRDECTHGSNGVSQVAFSRHDDPAYGAPPQTSMMSGYMTHAAGKNANWTPGLIPRVYGNPYPLARQSVGLGGELPILLGLMAFHARDGQSVEDIFLGSRNRPGLWHEYTWRSNESPPGYALSADETPRGYYVHICLDPENETGSTVANLSWLEWHSILVNG